jgi:endonuclease/exonuclease/phosphatase family metal-dependent hydrolase
VALRLLTWNVEGLNETRLGQRMEKLCLAMLVGTDLRAALAGAAMPPMPEVIALQEVVRVAHLGYFSPHLVAAGFRVWPAEPLERSHYELLAVRPPWTLNHIERRAFASSPLRREATVATISDGAAPPVTVVTAHLESLRSGREPRLAQLREIDAWLRAAPGPGVFAGDTNLRDEEWSLVSDALKLRDAFVEAGSPKAARVTWRPAGAARGGARFDRILLGRSVAVRELRLRSSRASDHDGLEALLSWA